MYTLLEIIAKSLTAELGTDFYVMPFGKKKNSPHVTIFPKSFMDYEQGRDKYNRGNDYLRVDNELHVDFILKARGKTRDFLEDFYTANKAITKKFRRPFNIDLANDPTYNVKVDLRKIENGGDYWTTEEGGEADDLYTMSELWQGVIKTKDHE